MKKVIAIAFSDTHFHEWPNHGQEVDRLELYYTLFNRLKELGKKYGTNLFLFSGDLLHSNSSMTNKTLKVITQIFNDFLTYNCLVAISGNHDQAELSTFDHHSTNWVESLAKAYSAILYIDRKAINIPLLGGKSIKVAGIPYMNDPESFNKVLQSLPKADKHTILLMHQTLPASSESSGFELESSFDLSIFDKLGKFGLVINGHIHKPQVHRPNIVTIGATHQQTLGDMGTRMGCYLIHEDYTYTFKDLGMPVFRYGDSDGWNYGVVQKKEEPIQREPEEKEFHVSNSPITLAENYLKKKKIKSPSKRKILIHYLK